MQRGRVNKDRKKAFVNALISVDFPFFYMWIPKINDPVSG